MGGRSAGTAAGVARGLAVSHEPPERARLAAAFRAYGQGRFLFEVRRQLGVRPPGLPESFEECDMAGLAQSLRAAWGVDLTTPGRDNIEDVIAAIDEHAATAALEVAAGVVRELLSRRSSE